MSPADILAGLVAGLRRERSRAGVTTQLKDIFGVRHVSLVSSGKAALSLILQALSREVPRREVIVPAYTCFSVASAVRRAGLVPVLCDINPMTLDLDYVQLKSLITSETLAVVVPHLLGHPAEIATAAQLARRVGAYVIEDAAQAMGSRVGDSWLGTMGDVGFFSVGRGKNVSAVSGGIILTNSADMAALLDHSAQRLPREPMGSPLKDLAVALATSLFVHPAVYWIPAGMPFLGLGETIYDEHFPMHDMNALRLGLLTSWRERLEKANQVRRENTLLYMHRLRVSENIRMIEKSRASIALRFPVLMPTPHSKAAICRIGRQEGLGISGLYPSTIEAIPELKGLLRASHCPGSQFVAERLVTLPVHPYVSAADVDRICTAIESVAALERPSEEGSPFDAGRMWAKEKTCPTSSI